MLRVLALFASCALALASPFNLSTIATINVYANANTDSAVIGASGPTWSRVLERAPWSPRAGGVVEFHPVDRRFIMYGIGIYEDRITDPDVWTDVWHGASNGRTWTKQTVRAGFSPVLSALTCQDASGNQYRIQGANRNRDHNADVYRSADGGRTWVAQHLLNGARLIDGGGGTRYLGAAVALKTSTLVIFGGQANSGDQDILADVWMSADSGKTWRQQTDRAPWGRRSVNVGLVARLGDTTTDVIYQMMGYAQWDPKTSRGLYTNDIWISTNLGQRWSVMHKYAPWVSRGDAQAEITDNGVMVVVGGIAGYVPGETEAILNDVWASLDGGWSWGLCSEDAPFSNRRFQYTALDDQGFLWMMGGRDDTETLVNDVWRSTHSFSDVNTVAIECGVLVPSCGSGLKCLPTSPGFKQGMWGVVCDACPNGPVVPASGAPVAPPSSSSGLSATWTGVVVILVLALVAAAAGAAYLYYKLRAVSQSGAGAGGEARWWGKNGTENLVGGTNTSTASDSLYNPLNIRDNTSM